MLYNNVISVYGHKRVLLVDVQASRYLFFDKTDFDESRNNSNHEINQILKEKQFTFPQEMDISQHSFPQLKCNNPFSHYFNAIVDVEKKHIENISILSDFLLNVNCSSLQIKFLENVADTDITKILRVLSEKLFLENLEIVADASSLTQSLFTHFENLPVHNITTYGKPNHGITHPLLKKHLDYNPFKENRIFFKFYFNQRFVTEAMHNNPYFYNKLYIDTDGNVYNAPELKPFCFSNLYVSDFEQIKRSIDEYMNQSPSCAAKNKILTCQDCELRFCCMDNRIVNNFGEHFMYKEHCLYNPYIAKWEGDDGYISVKECGDYTNEAGFIPNHEKIMEINKET